MTPTSTSNMVDTLPSCATLRQDVDVVQVEGKPLFGGMQALPAISQACAARHEVVLGLKDGATLPVPCHSPYQASARMYAADFGKIMRALNVPDAQGKR